jgi:hypothetical protein
MHTLTVGGTPATSNLFEATPNGVEVNFNARLVCSRNIFDGIETNAVYIQDCHIDTCIVEQNEITDAKFGVRCIFNSQGLVRIRENVIHSDVGHSGIGVQLSGISSFRGSPSTGRGAYEVHGNDIDVYGVGVFARTVDSLSVRDNSVDIRGKYAYLDIASGILVAGIDGAVVTDNQVTGHLPLSDTADGIRMEISGFSRVKCNEISGFRSCLRFWGNSLGAVVKYNEFHAGWQGLVLENGGNIGQQGGSNNPTGNQWLPTFPNSAWVCGPFATDRKMALSINTTTAGAIYVRNTPTHNPNIPQDCNSGQGGSVIPFVPTSGTTVEDCSISVDDDGGNSGTLRQIAGKAIPYPVFESETGYMARQTALGMMEANPALCMGDSLLSACHLELKGGTPGAILKSQSYLRAGQYPLAGQENGFVAKNLVELNHQAVTGMIIDLALDGTLTESAMLDLHSIAKQCPLSGGIAVYQARSIMTFLNPSTDYDNAACYLVSPKKQEGREPETSPKQGVKVWPNPALDRLNIESKLPVRIQLYDMYGKELHAFVHEGGQLELPVGKIARGILVVRYQFENGDGGAMKVVLQ